MLTVRRITTHDAMAQRDLRLFALADSPDAFGSTLAVEQDYGPEVWQGRCDSQADGNEAAAFLAFDDQSAGPASTAEGSPIGTAEGPPIGMVCVIPGALVGSTEVGMAELVSMFTAPQARGSGCGAALVAAVQEWAKGTEYRVVKLWVTRGNDAAERLYERCGFAITGEVAPLPSDPCKDEVRMQWLVPA